MFQSGCRFAGVLPLYIFVFDTFAAFAGLVHILFKITARPHASNAFLGIAHGEVYVVDNEDAKLWPPDIPT